MDGRFFTSDALVTVPLGRNRAVARADLAEAPPADDGLTPLHDPPLAVHDEAVFLLTAAAEIEHALMVQYLFAAYSVRVEPGGRGRPAGHREPAHRDRPRGDGPPRHRAEPAPPDRRPAQPQPGPGAYASDIYPFRFTLEPMTLVVAGQVRHRGKPPPAARGDAAGRCHAGLEDRRRRPGGQRRRPGPPRRPDLPADRAPARVPEAGRLGLPADDGRPTGPRRRLGLPPAPGHRGRGTHRRRSFTGTHRRRGSRRCGGRHPRDRRAGRGLRPAPGRYGRRVALRALP